MTTPTTVPGTLYIVATPVGNLKDITFRAVETLKQVPLIAAEDTRHTLKLLSHYEIKTQLISCHEHNELRQIPRIIQHLEQGLDAALVSDAGTPCISDPGYQLVKQVSQKGFSVIPIPGCSAAIAGLSVSGLPTDAFLFLGFLPKKKNRRKEVLTDRSREQATLILYESPKRIVSLCEEIIETLGDRMACLAREITKRHEEYIRGPVSQILANLEQRPAVKGECALFVAGFNESKPSIEDMDMAQLIRSKLEEKPWKTSELARSLSDTYGISKKQIYDMIVKIQS